MCRIDRRPRSASEPHDEDAEIEEQGKNGAGLPYPPAWQALTAWLRQCDAGDSANGGPSKPGDRGGGVAGSSCKGMGANHAPDEKGRGWQQGNCHWQFTGLKAPSAQEHQADEKYVNPSGRSGSNVFGVQCLAPLALMASSLAAAASVATGAYWTV